MNRCLTCYVIVEGRSSFCDRHGPNYPCSTCKSRGLCAADCSLAPWNFELVVGEIELKYPAPSQFAYLLRQRRWCGSPVDRRDVFFIDRWRA